MLSHLFIKFEKYFRDLFSLSTNKFKFKQYIPRLGEEKQNTTGVIFTFLYDR